MPRLPVENAKHALLAIGDEIAHHLDMKLQEVFARFPVEMPSNKERDRLGKRKALRDRPLPMQACLQLAAQLLDLCPCRLRL